MRYLLFCVFIPSLWLPLVCSQLAKFSCTLSNEKVAEIHSYQKTVNEIIALFLTGKFRGKTYDLLAELTDTFGPRMVGTQALEDTIDWVLDRAKNEGFTTYTENVIAPHWVRNNESLTMISPRFTPLSMLGLGYSIGTPPEGITAGVLVVSSFDELKASASEASGKIVVYDVPYTTYGDTVVYRSSGALEAAKVGAVASLVRSITDFSLYTPHTGMQTYSPDVKAIPTAAITVEDASMLHRMQNRGQKIVLKLTMAAETLADVVTRNTILEVEGSQEPEEVVVVSGHLDSWDVGNGVMDDAGGCVISWMAGKAVKELNLQPRRTLRTIMFTAEEFGLIGGEAYYQAHKNDADNFQLMMESDIGLFNPLGIAASGTEEYMCIMQEILSLTTIINTTTLISSAETPDLGSFARTGVPLGSLYNANDRYFWYHHSPADRIDGYDTQVLDKIGALWTSVAYVASDVSFRFPQKPELLHYNGPTIFSDGLN